MILVARRGRRVMIARGLHEGLQGVIVGKTSRGHPKVRLDEPTQRGNTLLEVQRRKLRTVRDGQPVRVPDPARSFPSLTPTSLAMVEGSITPDPVGPTYASAS